MRYEYDLTQKPGCAPTLRDLFDRAWIMVIGAFIWALIIWIIWKAMQ